MFVWAGSGVKCPPGPRLGFTAWLCHIALNASEAVSLEDQHPVTILDRQRPYS
jgi:hypothetical protein